MILINGKHYILMWNIDLLNEEYEFFIGQYSEIEDAFYTIGKEPPLNKEDVCITASLPSHWQISFCKNCGTANDINIKGIKKCCPDESIIYVTPKL